MWWVLSGLEIITGLTYINIHAVTNYADHLFFKWQYYPPARRAIYKTIRGVEVKCGYEYIWDTPFLSEQLQSGDTINHSFYLPDLTPATAIWGYINAPDGPYGLEIQGPLMRIQLWVEPPEWADVFYVATKAKGIYKTTDFSGPGEPQPTWTPDNDGLDSLAIACLAPDPFDPYSRRYVLAGGDVYLMENHLVPWPAVATKILTNAQAVALTGSTTGTIDWLACNPNHEDWIHAIFNSALTDNGIWFLRSPDRGDTWQTYQIYAGPWNRKAGNIMAGILQGTSPYEAEHVWYAALNTGGGGSFQIYLSTNNGFSWALRDTIGISIEQPRCLVDPTDQSIVYTGAYINALNRKELYRSEDHGANLTLADGLDHLGIFLGLLLGQLWIDPFDNTHARALRDNHIWQTTDYCANWTDHGLIPAVVHGIAVQPWHTDHLYLARETPIALPPPLPQAHMIHVTTDEGATTWPKAGDHPDQNDGGGDSIPWNCGGIVPEGMSPLIYT